MSVHALAGRAHATAVTLLADLRARAARASASRAGRPPRGSSASRIGRALRGPSTSGIGRALPGPSASRAGRALRASCGQGTVEYVGLILLVAVLIAGVVTASRSFSDTGIAEAVVKKIKGAIDGVAEKR